MKRLLLIGPLPPPYTGNSLPLEKSQRHLESSGEWTVTTMNLNGQSNASGVLSFRRVWFYLRAWRRFRRLHRAHDVVYLSNAESRLGNLRDLGFYTLAGRSIRRMIVHMLGGANLAKLYDPRTNPRLTRLNRARLRDVGGVVVEARQQKRTFENVTGADRIHVIPNFAEQYLFVDPAAIRQKFGERAPLRILFLSNLLPGKGHRELLAGFLDLPADRRERLRLDFAGAHGDGDFEEVLAKAAAAHPNVHYHGSVNAEEKTALYAEAHVFCLPTYYPYEGQPFTIVEAYASGCVVVTALHSGIPEIFADGANGYAIESRSPAAVTAMLERLLDGGDELAQLALDNHRRARERHSETAYLTAVRGLIEDVATR